MNSVIWWLLISRDKSFYLCLVYIRTIIFIKEHGHIRNIRLIRLLSFRHYVMGVHNCSGNTCQVFKQHAANHCWVRTGDIADQNHKKSGFKRLSQCKHAQNIWSKRKIFHQSFIRYLLSCPFLWFSPVQLIIHNFLPYFDFKCVENTSRHMCKTHSFADIVFRNWIP